MWPSHIARPPLGSPRPRAGAAPCVGTAPRAARGATNVLEENSERSWSFSKGVAKLLLLHVFYWLWSSCRKPLMTNFGWRSSLSDTF